MASQVELHVVVRDCSNQGTVLAPLGLNTKLDDMINWSFHSALGLISLLIFWINFATSFMSHHLQKLKQNK